MDEYLKCISVIAHRLREAAGPKSKRRLLGLGKQCFDRVAYFVEGGHDKSGDQGKHLEIGGGGRSADKAKSFSTLADVRKENAELLRSYEERLKSLEMSKSKASRDTLSLSLIRKCRENISIAKSRQQKLNNKVLERQEKMLSDSELRKKKTQSLNFILHPKSYTTMDWR